jgi:hypothetical protein
LQQLKALWQTGSGSLFFFLSFFLGSRKFMKKYNKEVKNKKKTIMVVVDRRLDRVTDLTWLGMSFIRSKSGGGQIFKASFMQR